jgi:hypothetical protein
MEAPMASLRIAAASSRPVTTAETRVVGVPGAMGGLFPEGGIRRGSTVGIGPGAGATSLALAIVGGVTGGGGWVAAVGMPSLGLVAAAELGVDLDRMALVPDPGPQWVAVVAALVDGVDLLMLRPPGRARGADARRLAARVRERGTVLVVVERGDRDGGWPESPDVRLSVTGSEWEGLGCGYGSLRSRRVEVVVTGRRAAARERRMTFLLPGEGGTATDVPAPEAVHGGDIGEPAVMVG